MSLLVAGCEVGSTSFLSSEAVTVCVVRRIDVIVVIVVVVVAVVVGVVVVVAVVVVAVW